MVSGALVALQRPARTASSADRAGAALLAPRSSPSAPAWSSSPRSWPRCRRGRRGRSARAARTGCRGGTYCGGLGRRHRWSPSPRAPCPLDRRRAAFTVGLVAGQAAGALARRPRPGLGPGGPPSRSPAPRVARGRPGAAGRRWRSPSAYDTAAGAPGASARCILAASAVGRAACWSRSSRRFNGRVQPPRPARRRRRRRCVNFVVGTAALLAGVADRGRLLAGCRGRAGWPGPARPVPLPRRPARRRPTSPWPRCAVRRPRRPPARRSALVAGQLAGGVLIDLVSPGRTGGVDAATLAGVLLDLRRHRAGRPATRSEQVAAADQQQRECREGDQVARAGSTVAWPPVRVSSTPGVGSGAAGAHDRADQRARAGAGQDRGERLHRPEQLPTPRSRFSTTSAQTRPSPTDSAGPRASGAQQEADQRPHLHHQERRRRVDPASRRPGPARRPATRRPATSSDSPKHSTRVASTVATTNTVSAASEPGDRGRPRRALGEHRLPGPPAVAVARHERAEHQHQRAAEHRHALEQHVGDVRRQDLGQQALRGTPSLEKLWVARRVRM